MHIPIHLIVHAIYQLVKAQVTHRGAKRSAPACLRFIALPTWAHETPAPREQPVTFRFDPCGRHHARARVNDLTSRKEVKFMPIPTHLRPDGKLQAQFEPGLQLFRTPGVYADPAAPSSLAATDEQGPAVLIEIGLGKRQRLLDAQPGSPQDHDQAAQPAAMRVVSRGTHDGDDLLHPWRIGRIAQTLLRGGRPPWNPGMVAGDLRRPARSSSSSDVRPPRVRGACSGSAESRSEVTPAATPPLDRCCFATEN
jgi:hypothetical protein